MIRKREGKEMTCMNSTSCSAHKACCKVVKDLLPVAKAAFNNQIFAELFPCTLVVRVFVAVGQNHYYNASRSFML
jgi:hypothetical protein